MKDKKKLQALKDVGKEVIDQLAKFANPPITTVKQLYSFVKIKKKVKKAVVY